MKATANDYAKLKVEGCIFQTKSRRGWYYKGVFIGYSTLEAIEVINRIKAHKRS